MNETESMMFFLKKKCREFNGVIRTVSLFGIFPIFRQVIAPLSVKTYLFGFKIRTGPGYAEKHQFRYENGRWYSFFGEKNASSMPTAPAPNTVPTVGPNAAIQMDIDRALRCLPRIDRIALVFFMGIGDYFYAVRFIDRLKKKYPQLPFVAYVSKNTDSNTSPLVAECCRVNPCFEDVQFYDGAPNRDNWKAYDYSDVLRREPETTLVLPMLYEHNALVLSRDDTLCETFCLPTEKLAKKPLLFDWKAEDFVIETANKIEDEIHRRSLRGVVWLQFNTRSTSFVYKYPGELVSRLINAGFFVVSVDPVAADHSPCLVLDYSKFRITDSIALLRLLNEKVQTFCFTMVSCFWSISSALDIPNLGVQFYYDEKLMSVYFSNIYIVTHQKYRCVPRTRQFIASPEDYDKGFDHKQYRPEYLFDCFKAMLERVEEERRFR